MPNYFLELSCYRLDDNVGRLRIIIKPEVRIMYSKRRFFNGGIYNSDEAGTRGGYFTACSL